ncbi:hypothetical protein HK104_001500 [Borealophlyctis nickersoniae]|nr:hypothetical protein HK104_001500 [Borealophlyctis nickersoniae]
MSDDGKGPTPSSGVSNLAKFFETQVASADTPPGAPPRPAPVSPSKPRPPSVHFSGAPHYSYAGARTSTYGGNLAPPSPARAWGGSAGSVAGNASGGTSGGAPRFPAGGVPGGGGGRSAPRPGGRERSASVGTGEAEQGEQRRLSVSRLSRMFESDVNIVPGGAPTSGPMHRTLVPGSNGTAMQRAVSASHLPPNNSRRAPPPPRPVKPAALSVSSSADNLPRFSTTSSRNSINRISYAESVTSTHSTQNHVEENPFIGDEEKDSSDSAAIEVPPVVPLAQRIAMFSSASAPVSPRTSLYSPPNRVSPTHSGASSPPAAVKRHPPPPPSHVSRNSVTTPPAKKLAPPPPITASPTSRRHLIASPMGSPIAPEPATRFSPPSRADSLSPPGRPPNDNYRGRADGVKSPTLVLSRQGSSAGSVASVEASDEEGKATRKESKRQKIVAEIVDTERQFLNDMEVMMEVYARPAGEKQVLAAHDIKILFGNLDVIIETSTKLLDLLEAASTATDMWIGEAFNQMMREIEDTYCEYCKHNEAAMAKLAEFSSPQCLPQIQHFLKVANSKSDAQSQLQGKTGAWDLGSLVIKPVQRVLKYPLLIKSLLKETSPQSPDFDQLVKASEAIEGVAEKINEVKRRKDIVEKYVEGKANANVIHGITKKWVRGTQQLKQATGISDTETTTDMFYDALVEKLDLQYRSAQQLNKDLTFWVRSVKDYFDLQETMAITLEEIYSMSSDRSVGNDSGYFHAILEYRKACSRIAIGPWRDAESKIKTTIHPALETLMNRFKEPNLIMNKRNKKLLDYDRARAMRARGEPVDKTLLESAEAYSSLNAQLLEELPKFLDLVCKYIDIVVCHIADIQAQVYRDIRIELMPLADALRGGADGIAGDIIGEYARHMEIGGPVEVATRDISTLWKWREFIWMDNSEHLLLPMGADASRRRSWVEPRSRPTSMSDNDFRRSILVRKASAGHVGGSAVRPHLFRNMSDSRREEDRVPTGPLIDFEDPPSSQPQSRPMDSESLLRQAVLVSSKSPASLRSNTTLHPQPSHYARSRTPSPPPHSAYDDAPGSVLFDATAIYPFHAETPDELDLDFGTVVTVVKIGGRDDETGNDWWYGATRNGKRGWFPGSYVQTEEDDDQWESNE